MASPENPPQSGEDLSGIHLWLVLWKAYKALERHDRASIRALGLGGISDFAVLEVLLHKGPRPVGALGEALSLTSGSITTAVDRAEKKGRVRRRPHESDRRAVVVELTPAGRRLIERAFRQHAIAMEHAVRTLGTEERAHLLPLLRKLGKAAERDFFAPSK